MELIAFASGKGGTGKTLLASCLGYCLVRSGQRVLMIDADPATDGLSLFLLGKNGVRQISAFESMNTFTGALRGFQETRKLNYEPRKIRRIGTDQQGDHGISYEALISGRYIYGDARSTTELLAVPDLDQDTFRKAVSALFTSIKESGKYDYVVVDTRGGFAFESTDVCALADSFIVITEPDYTSFYQDRNLVRRISDAAKELNTKPLLRSIIVNKATETEQKDENTDLEKLEVSFRVQLEKEFPVKFLDTHPIPVDVEALKAYKTQRIPYLAAPASLFSFATLSAYRDILQVVTARWTEEQVQSWNSLIETVSKAIADRNKRVHEDRARQHEMEKRLKGLEAENLSLKDRAEELKREMERLEHSYERELQRAAGILDRIPQGIPNTSQSAPKQEAKDPALQNRRRSLTAASIAMSLLTLLTAFGFGGIWWWLHRNPRTPAQQQDYLVQQAYDTTLSPDVRAADVNELARKGYRKFDGINLAGAKLAGIPLDGSSFRSANLSNAIFGDSLLSRTDFTGATLSAVSLTGANLSGALLKNADLTGANLSRALLRDTDLEDASLVGAHLEGADLTGARVRQAQLEASYKDQLTVLPKVYLPSIRLSPPNDSSLESTPATSPPDGASTKTVRQTRSKKSKK